MQIKCNHSKWIKIYENAHKERTSAHRVIGNKCWMQNINQIKLSSGIETEKHNNPLTEDEHQTSEEERKTNAIHNWICTELSAVQLS